MEKDICCAGNLEFELEEMEKVFSENLEDEMVATSSTRCGSYLTIICC